MSPFVFPKCPSLKTWFLGPTQVCPTNGISVNLACFAGLTVVTDTHMNTQNVSELLRITVAWLEIELRCNSI